MLLKPSTLRCVRQQMRIVRGLGNGDVAPSVTGGFGHIGRQHGQRNASAIAPHPVALHREMPGGAGGMQRGDHITVAQALGERRGHRHRIDGIDDHGVDQHARQKNIDMLAAGQTEESLRRAFGQRLDQRLHAALASAGDRKAQRMRRGRRGLTDGVDRQILQRGQRRPSRSALALDMMRPS